MTLTYERYKRELALLMIVAIVISISFDTDMREINYGIPGVKYYKFCSYTCGDGIGDANNHGYYTL